jgi:hypothetical protein
MAVDGVLAKCVNGQSTAKSRMQVPKMEAQPTAMSAASHAQVSRTLALKRAFQRELGRKPTCLQRTAIDRAATLTAKAEAAALDPVTTANDVVRLDHAAARARAEMFAMFAAKRESDDGASDLDRYLQRRAAENEAAP